MRPRALFVVIDDFKIFLSCFQTLVSDRLMNGLIFMFAVCTLLRGYEEL